MRAEPDAVPDRALPQPDNPVGWASRIRSISFVEMGRSAASSSMKQSLLPARSSVAE